MEAKLQLRIQRYGWDKAAADYEEYWRKQIEPAQKRLLEMAALVGGERVLDIACGTGLITFPAAMSVGAQGSVVGTDISEKMIERGRENAARQGLANVTFQRADAAASDFPESSFDAVLCSLGLMYVPEPIHALRRASQLLKPGGRMAAAVWGAARPLRLGRDFSGGGRACEIGGLSDVLPVGNGRQFADGDGNGRLR